MFFPLAGRKEDVAVVAGDGQHLRGHVLGQAVGEMLAVRMQHLDDSGDLAGGFGFLGSFDLVVEPTLVRLRPELRVSQRARIIHSNAFRRGVCYRASSDGRAEQSHAHNGKQHSNRS